MAKLLKLRRGTTSQHGSFTGAEGEVTVDTDKETLVVHDGSTAGGHPVAAEDMANVTAANIKGRLGSTLTNTEINASAAIAGTKISPDFGSQNITTTGSATISGELIVNGNTTAKIHLQDSNHNPDYEISNADGVLRVRDTTNAANRIMVNTDGHIDLKSNVDCESGLDVTGNITVSGTVDGVDVAARNTLFGGLTSSSGVLTDGVTATTQAQSDNTTKVSTTAYVRTAIANAQAFPSGTVMLFYQASAPTGWTKVTTQNNKALRVVSGTGGGTGGSNAFTDTLTGSIGITANAANTTATGNVSVANNTAGGSVSIANASTGGTVNNHTLTTAEMPSHSHSYQQNYDCNNVISGYQNWGITCNANQGSNTGNTGGGGGHSHGFTGGSHNHNANFTGSAHAHNASFTGSAHNHSITVGNLDLAVQYVDVILASKD